MKKKMIILGAGESGVGAAMLAKQKGFDVFVSEANSLGSKYKAELESMEVAFEERQHSIERILQADIVIKSPGIPSHVNVVREVVAAGIEMISEIEFAWRYIGESKVISVTGSNGKTTVTAMIGHILKAAGVDCAVVGNIGYSFARQVATAPKKVYVVEVSSFQLDQIVTFKPDISVLTNITEDHLDRYEFVFENYIRSKFRIMMNQTMGDVFIYNAEDAVTNKYVNQFLNNVKAVPISMSKQLPEGAYIVNEEMHIKWLKEDMTMSVEDFALKGKHNQYNTMAAGLSAAVMGIRKEKIREAVKTFESLDHRMALVSTIKGVDFINDSKSTNVNSTWYALESMQKPTILIMGGVDKGNKYEILKELVQEKVKAIVCLGTDNTKIHEAFTDDVSLIMDASTAEEAVQIAYNMSEKGDVVLLSPACASFDLFENYEDRGRQFIHAVKSL